MDQEITASEQLTSDGQLRHLLSLKGLDQLWIHEILSQSEHYLRKPGEADVSHPTQGLLDLLTIRQHKGNFENLVVTIIGDIAHSRVARSASEGELRKRRA